MKLKTRAWPEGRDWPDEILLEVGSNMPMDVHGTYKQGVRYVRKDLQTPNTSINQQTKGKL